MCWIRTRWLREGGGIVSNTLKGDGTEKTGEETKILKKGGILGQGMDALKRGVETPL